MDVNERFRPGAPGTALWSVPVEETPLVTLRGAYEAHYARVFGAKPLVFREVGGTGLLVDVYAFPPRMNRPYTVLATLGMSDRAMRVPVAVERDTRLAGQAALARAELMLALPPAWPLSQSAFTDERYYWPLRLLRRLARLPHEEGTWLGWGHTVPHGRPLAPGVPFRGVTLAAPFLTGPDAGTVTGPGAEGRVYAALPVFDDEMNFKLRYGASALLERLRRAGHSELVDVHRASVAPRERRLAWPRLRN